MKKEWQGSTDGSTWMQQCLIRGFKHIDIRVYYFVMALVIPFYVLFKGTFGDTYRFYRLRLGLGRFKSIASGIRNYYSFGKVVIDRFASYAGVRFNFEVDNPAFFEELQQSSEPMVILSSHVGNYEIGGYNFGLKSRRINALVFAGETSTVMKNRDRIFERTNINMIPLMPDLSHIFAINSALNAGEVVSMPADRCHGSEKHIDCEFFGVDARFPAGPFITIERKGVSAAVLFVMREKGLTYKFFSYKLELPKDLKGRDERTKYLAGEYARVLERMVRQYPTQWYNFYDFWKR